MRIGDQASPQSTHESNEERDIMTSRMQLGLLTRALIVALAWSAASPGHAAEQDPGWPRELTRDDATLVYYQPQIDDWNDFKEINGRMAISVTPRGGKPQV